MYSPKDLRSQLDTIKGANIIPALDSIYIYHGSNIVYSGTVREYIPRHCITVRENIRQDYIEQGFK